MSILMVCVRRNPCDEHEGFQVGFMEDGFDTEILKSIRFGMSTSDLFRFIGLTPNRALKLFPSCGVPDDKLSWKLRRSLAGWRPGLWRHLGLLLTETEFQRLANLTKFPVVRYIYDKKGGDRIVHLIARTDPC